MEAARQTGSLSPIVYHLHAYCDCEAHPTYSLWVQAQVVSLTCRAIIYEADNRSFPIAFMTARNQEQEHNMKKSSALIVGLSIIAAAATPTVTPAFALGGCGPNHHRSSVTGRCIWGGQNQQWCVRHTGHPAVKGPNGTWICIR